MSVREPGAVEEPLPEVWAMATAPVAMIAAASEIPIIREDERVIQILQSYDHLDEG
jgi:septum formation inhibitor-activating ATPase MinD